MSTPQQSTVQVVKPRPPHFPPRFSVPRYPVVKPIDSEFDLVPSNDNVQPSKSQSTKQVPRRQSPFDDYWIMEPLWQLFNFQNFWLLQKAENITISEDKSALF